DNTLALKFIPYRLLHCMRHLICLKGFEHTSFSICLYNNRNLYFLKLRKCFMKTCLVDLPILLRFLRLILKALDVFWCSCLRKILWNQLIECKAVWDGHYVESSTYFCNVFY